MLVHRAGLTHLVRKCSVVSASVRSWGTVLELESVQRRFTRLIDEVGTLPYSRRLEIIDLTKQAEQRIHGDLIEAFKVTSGSTNYGSGMFRIF